MVLALAAFAIRDGASSMLNFSWQPKCWSQYCSALCRETNEVVKKTIDSLQNLDEVSIASRKAHEVIQSTQDLVQRCLSDTRLSKAQVTHFLGMEPCLFTFISSTLAVQMLS